MLLALSLNGTENSCNTFHILFCTSQF